MATLAVQPPRTTTQADANAPAVIAARGLGRLVGERWILRNVDLDLTPGRTLALLGPNGAGKSTLLGLLATLHKPTEGRLELFGQPTDRQTPRLRASIGMVAHRPMLYRDLTLLENLLFFGRLYSVAEPVRRAWELLERVSLAHRAHDCVHTLSQGMTQRVAIARALMHQPRLILADEPFAGIDLPSAEAIMRLLMELTADGCALLISLHDVERAVDMSQDVLVLRQGRSAWSGPTDSTDAASLRREVMGG